MIQQDMDQWKNTLTDAKQVDPSIKLDDVKESFNKCIEQNNTYTCMFSSHCRHCNELDGWWYDDDMMMIWWWYDMMMIMMMGFL